MDSQGKPWTYRRVVIVFTSIVGSFVVACVVAGVLLSHEPSVAVRIYVAAGAGGVASVVWLALAGRRIRNSANSHSSTTSRRAER